MEFLALLPIVWLVVFLMTREGSGNSTASSPSGSRKPGASQRIILSKSVYYRAYVIVDNAWFFRDSNTYLAHVRCPYDDHHLTVEAPSQDELEQKLEELARQIAREVEQEFSMQ